jgi:PfaB family protein
MLGADSTERIAIVGLGGIFPGAPDLDVFWSNLAAGVDSGRHVPAGRWYLSPEKAYAPWPPQPDRVYSTWGCFIEGFEFDPTGLDLDPVLLSKLDPMFHLGLHAARAAFRNARELRGIDRTRVGVILGNIALPTESTSAICRDVLGRTFVEHLIETAEAASRNREAVDSTHRSRFTDPGAASRLKAQLKRSHWDPLNRLAAGLPASLIAQGLGLGGIAFTLDAACASSLYSLKFAAEELLSHRADAMLAGGMSRPDCQYTQMGFAQLQALSRRGRCAPLSADADGLVVGEGAGVFVLKRLSDAIASGDRIYGVIAGIGLSNDRGANLLAPHSEGQLRAMRSAYDQGGWRPADVDLIECHATGTPVGDAVEIASLHELWNTELTQPGQCVIGGVKSNVGHLLTGAGAAGLMKVLFALQNQTLPPTANFRQPAERLAAADSPFQVLDKATTWRRREVTDPQGQHRLIPRRAAINAFGFGGINAHVLIEEWNGPDTPAVPSAILGDAGRRDLGKVTTTDVGSNVPVAVVGFDAQWGAWDSGPSVQHGYLRGTSPPIRDLAWWGVEQSDWFRRECLDQGFSRTRSVPIVARGESMSEIRLAMGEYRIPPLEMQDMLAQQQLMLKTTAGALRDAGQHDSASSHSIPDDSLSNRTGVFIAIELDPNTTNFHFRWSIEQDAPAWARQLGLELTDVELADWIRSLKDAAGPPLTANRVMGNLGGIVASRLAREFDVGGPCFTVSSGERTDVVALNLAVRALQRGELDKAIVGSVEIASDPRWHAFPSRVSSDDRQSEQHIEVPGRDAAEAFVLTRLSDAVRTQDRTYAVIREPNPDLNDIEIKGSVDRPAWSHLEFNGDSHRLESNSLVPPLLLAYHGLALETPPRASADVSDGFVGRALPVLRRHHVRLASSVEFRRGASTWELLIEEPEFSASSRFEHEHRRPLGELPVGLFVIDGDTTSDLLKSLAELEETVGTAQSMEQHARQWIQTHPPQTHRRLAMSMIAASPGELQELILRARSQLQGEPSSAAGLSKPLFFNPEPFAPRGRVAFVFPGSGNAFRQMGQSLLTEFPEVLRRQQQENDDLPGQYAGVFAQGVTAPELDHKTMIFSQVAIGTAICDLLSRFRVCPDASLGYSLGESAALFGLRAWIDRDEMLQRMRRSPLFGSDLVAPYDAARIAWQVPRDHSVPWLSGIVDRSAAEVHAGIAAIQLDDGAADSSPPKIYLLIVNTPRQCVVGGVRSQVERLVRELNATFIPLASPSTVHCEVLRAVESDYRKLHLMPTTAPRVDTPDDSKPIDFYSTAWGQRYPLTRESAAEAIVAQAVNSIDFPKVIEQSYADGIRIFVEIGPGSSCTRMITEILGERPFFARAALPATSRPVEAFLELLAALIAERVPVDLSYLYAPVTLPVDQKSKGTRREVTTRIGGSPFQISAPQGGWRFIPLPAPPQSEMVSTEEPPPELTPVELTKTRLHQMDGSNEDPYDDAPTLPEVPGQQWVTAPNPVTANVLQVAESPNQNESLFQIWKQFQLMTDSRAEAHETFLRLSGRMEQLAAEQLAFLARVESDLATPALGGAGANAEIAPLQVTISNVATSVNPTVSPPALIEEPPRYLTREQCMEFAIGRIGSVLGRRFAAIDNHPTRVRLPDEPLMLVDRILNIEGEPLSMTSGRVITEHDIHPGAWYLDCGRIPTCIAVESGQADLFLSGWLGIDFETRGVASYRLLDAVVTFHDALPQPGKTIHYDIRVLHFFRQGTTYLFRFEFDATVDGRPLLTMREGCAGFFTEQELAGGKGIIHTALDQRPRPGKRPADWNDPVPMGVEAYDDRQLLALRNGDLATCFGPAFQGVPLRKPVTLPGLDRSSDGSPQRSRMWLIDRVLKLDPVGGKFSLGTILGELDIHPDDWFLTCHFCDDQVMPGTLMYECCLHTLRIYLLRMGWIGEADQIVYEPIPEVRSRLKCRGQVLAGTSKVWYEITLKEIGYGAPSQSAGSSSNPSTPYCLADALMYADGKAIVEITDMSVRLTGLTREAVERLWSARRPRHMSAPLTPTVAAPVYDRRPAIFDTDRITAFAIGKPSDAFGDRYLPFDSRRKIARLPGPPFQFLDRVVSIQNCEPWILLAGGEIVAQYDVPQDAWYFASNRQPEMPFAVLLETALQPCGWLAGYLGSALTSETDLSFRNLGGTATQFLPVTPTSGTLTTTVKMTRVSNSAGMIIQHYDFDLRCGDESVYKGNTYFGFFSKEALSNQIGIREATPYQPTEREVAAAKSGSYPPDAPFPDEQFRMIQTVECLSRDGGPYRQGCIVGTMPVDPSAWFFKAHFYEDPVVPGSLGLESFWQLLKVWAADRWRLGPDARFATPLIAPSGSAPVSPKHEWVYRGQVIPRDRMVTVTAVIREVDDARRTLTAEGYLTVDGRVIYQMKNFQLGCQ